MEQFLIQIFVLLKFSAPPPFSKSCVRYWMDPWSSWVLEVHGTRGNCPPAPSRRPWSWVMTERMRSQMQGPNEVFAKNERVTLFNKMRSSEIGKSLNIEPLLLQIEKSQLWWFGHVSRMPQERLPKQALLAKANGRRPLERPRTRWNYIVDFAQAKWWRWWKTEKCGGLISSCCPRNSHGKSGKWRKKKKERRRIDRLEVYVVFWLVIFFFNQSQNNAVSIQGQDIFEDL